MPDLRKLAVVLVLGLLAPAAAGAQTLKVAMGSDVMI